MRTFDVQAIEIDAPREDVFGFVENPANLPRWTRAFKRADASSARLVTPAGELDIGLKTKADANACTVDWRLEFPDGAVALAQSRVTETTRGPCIYSFVLHAPPVPLEQIEGTLEEQSRLLEEELRTLKQLMESSAGAPR